MGFEDENLGGEMSPGHRKGSHLAVLLIITVGVDLVCLVKVLWPDFSLHSFVLSTSSLVCILNSLSRVSKHRLPAEVDNHALSLPGLSTHD